MIAKVRTAVFAILPLAISGTTFAQEHGSAEEHRRQECWPPLSRASRPCVVAIGVFIVVFAILSIKVWPTIVKGLKDREMKIRTSIEEAEQAQKQAREALEQYERNLASARAEAQKMLDDAKVQQQAIAAELRQKSDMELAMMRDKAKRDIDAAKSTAIAEIHAHATSLATAMAAKILKREINAGDQQRMIQESLQEMGAGRA